MYPRPARGATIWQAQAPPGILVAMSASLTVQLCRIIAPERLSDRLLSSGVLTASESRSLTEQVVLVYLFEVMQPWLPSAKLLPSLTATLEANYPKLNDPANQSVDDKFELLLREVNQTLNAVSEAGETDWIGNLNGMIMVLSGDELHFAQAGQCPAYLLQNNRIRQITDDAGATPADAHPLKTFSNLASGQLKEGDQILLANRELYREISLDALRRILNTASPYQAGQAIAKELKREKNPAVSTIMLKFLGAPPAQAEPESVILEEELQGGFKKLQRKLKPLLERGKTAAQQAGAVTGTALSSASKQAQGVWNEKVAPKAAELLDKGAKAVQDPEAPAPPPAPPEALPEERPVVEIIVSKKQKEKLHLQAIAEAAEARAEQEPDDDFVSIIPEEERNLEEKSTPEHKVLHTAKLGVLGIVGSIMTFLRPWLRKLASWLRLPGNRRKAALGSGLVILGLTVWIGISAARTPSGGEGRESNASILTDVRALKESIATAIELDQTVEASNSVESALAKLGALNEPTSSQQEEADELWAAIRAQADTLTATTRFSATSATYTLGSDPRGLLTALPYFYGWNPTSNQLTRTGRGDSDQTQATVTLADTNDSIVSVAHSTEEETTGYALTKQSKVYRLVQIGVDTRLQAITPADGEFRVGDAISSYAGNVYILDGKAGLLWRYSNTGTQYTKGTSIIDTNKYDIRKGVSLAIDGSIYILKSDGSVQKFTSGKQDATFELRSVPQLAQRLVQPLQVITNETFPSLYVLDAGTTSSSWSDARVLELSKDGTYIRQYAFPKEFTNVRGFDINPKEKKMWVLNGTTVAEFDLP